MLNSTNEFFNTITFDILSIKDFVNWEEINRKVSELRREIALIQSLDKENPLDDLSDLLNKFPNTLKVLKLLVAHTPDKLYFLDTNQSIDFKEDLNRICYDIVRAREIAQIFIDIGLIFFLKEVKCVEDIVKGVYIGLEPNSRKNRRGEKLETIVKDLLLDVIDKISKQKKLNLELTTQFYIDLGNEQKKCDFVITLDNEPKVCIEINFYSTSGSKPSETIGRAYPEVQNNLKKKNIGLIVITDGRGWLEMKPVIETSIAKLNYLMNFRQAREGYLERAILEILS